MRSVRPLSAGAIFLAIASASAFAQTPEPQPTFASASVKPAALHSPRNVVGGPGSHNPGQISYSDASLQELILLAYGLDDAKKISGPSWLDTLRYDIVAKLPAGTTKEQLSNMLASLLSERFKLKLHHESKEVPAYDLVVAEGGLKLKQAEAAYPASLKLSPERANYPTLPSGTIPALAVVADHGRALLNARQEPPAVLAKMLSGPAGRPVVDKTGVTERYSFVLDFDFQLTAGQAPKEAAGPDDDPALSLFDALEQKLGLKLVASRTAVDTLVVDSAEKVPFGD